MNRRDLVLALAEHTDTDRKTADEFLNAFVEVVTETVSTGEPVAISGFAKFARVDRAARMGRNPATGEQIRIKASRKARITPLKAFKDSVNSGKAPAKKKASAKKASTKKATTRGPAKKKAATKKASTKKKASSARR